MRWKLVHGYLLSLVVAVLFRSDHHHRAAVPPVGSGSMEADAGSDRVICRSGASADA